jgi:hypothetical protein
MFDFTSLNVHLFRHKAFTYKRQTSYNTVYQKYLSPHCSSASSTIKSTSTQRINHICLHAVPSSVNCAFALLDLIYSWISVLGMSEIHVWLSPEKQFIKCKGKMNENFGPISRHSMSAWQVSWKADFLCPVMNNFFSLFLALNFVFLHTTQKNWFFMKQLWKHIGHRDVHATFFIGTFWNFECV